MTTAEFRATRIKYLESELAKAVAAREAAHQRAFNLWSFETLPRDPKAPFNAPETLALDIKISDILDELETLTDEMENAL